MFAASSTPTPQLTFELNFRNESVKHVDPTNIGMVFVVCFSMPLQTTQQISRGREISCTGKDVV